MWPRDERLTDAELCKATQVLLQFCLEHNYENPHVHDIRDCLAALERGDKGAAIAAYKRVPLGGMGCFNDWFPPAVLPGEDGNQIWRIFEALTTRWSLGMRGIIDSPGGSPGSIMA